MDWNTTDFEKLIPGTTPQLGLDAYEFEKAYSKQGIAYSYEFALLVEQTYRLSQKLGRPISILEVGVGAGRVGAFLYQLPWISNYLGIDTELTCIELCKKRHQNLPVRLQNLLLVSPSQKWDMVIMPYGTFSGIAQNRQEIMFLKMIHHSNYITLIDTMVPEAHGVEGDVVYENDGQELSLLVAYTDCLVSWETYKEWVLRYNNTNKATQITAHYTGYPFIYEGLERQDHQMVIIEKRLS